MEFGRISAISVLLALILNMHGFVKVYDVLHYICATIVRNFESCNSNMHGFMKVYDVLH